MSVVANTQSYPYSAVVRVVVTFTDGNVAQGSGAVVGPNDILTAAHLVFRFGKTIQTIKITPAQNGEFAPLGDHYGQTPAWHEVDLDGDGMLSSSDMAVDLAIIPVNYPIADLTGRFLLEDALPTGTVYKAGYPASSNGQMVESSGTMPTYWRLYNIDAIAHDKGDSGAPLFTLGADGAYLHSLVSTTHYGPSLFWNDVWLGQQLAANDWLIGYPADINTRGAGGASSAEAYQLDPNAVIKDTVLLFEEDYFKVQTPRAGTLLLTASSGRGDVDLAYATTSSGTVEAAHPHDGRMEQTAVTLAANEWTSLRVEGASPLKSHYTLTTRFLPAAAGEAMLSEGGAMNGEAGNSRETAASVTGNALWGGMVGIGQDSADWYRFTTNQQGQLTLYLTGLTGDHATLLLENDAGQTVRSQTLSSGDHHLLIDCSGAPAGDYYARVTGDGGATFYSLGIESGPDAVYRFYNINNNSHFYTANCDERNQLLAGPASLVYEGAAFQSGNTSTAQPVHRFYQTQTGTHFYTISEAEKNLITATLPQYHYDGVAYQAYTEAGADTTPLYRFYNTQAGVHFYTASSAERDQVLQTLPHLAYEGIAYHVDIM